MQTIQGLLLDIDGTFVDSNGAHAAAFSAAAAESGLTIPVERFRRLIGMGGDKLLPAVGIEPNSKVAEDVKRRKKEIFEERFLPRLNPFHGARDLLMHCKALGLKLVVATSAPADELDQLLHAGRIDDVVDHQATASDASSSTPDPDIVEAAIERAKLGRDALVMIGDTPYDVEAALRAGVPIIGFRSGGWSTKDLEGAIAVYDGPAELLATFDASPLGPAAHRQRK